MNARQTTKSVLRRLISLALALIYVLMLVPTLAAAADNPSGPQSAVETGRNSGSQQVHVIVENNTFTPESEDWEDQYWYGTLVDRWVDIESDSTAMSCIVAALTAAGYSQEGAENNYISSIAGLGEFDGGSMSGWMGTLNDWFTNEGFGAFTVANGKLSDGDIINVVYTLNYGEDCGGSWGNTDTSLKGMHISAGSLSPAFSSATKAYTLTVSQGTESVYVTPSAANKNYQARIFVGSTEYKRTAPVPVQEGTEITVKVGDPSWPSMNSGGEATTYSVTVEKEKPEVKNIDISVNIPNAASAKLYALPDTDMENNLLLSAESAYLASVPANAYKLVLFDENNISLGSIVIPVSEDQKIFTAYAVSVICGNDGWVYGTDYTLKADARSGGSEATVVRDITIGTAGKNFPCLDGDNVSATIVPSAAKKTAGYASATGASVVTGTNYASVSATCNMAATLKVTYPYADSNEDGKNDYVLEVGKLTSYFVFSYLQPDETSKPENDTVTAVFTGLPAESHYYRVSNPHNSSSVSYGTYKTLTVGENTAVVTAAELCENDGSFNKNTIFCSNAYDVADLYLSVDGDYQGNRYDGAAGQLNLSAGDTATLYPYRNWLPINSVTGNVMMFPDYHVKAVTLDGSNPVTVTENTDDNGGKHSFNIQANSAGTAILLVTYDALSYGGAVGGDHFSAIFPENTGVIVVTVGKSTTLSANMTINENLNTTQANKYAVERYDAELDVLYYSGTSGASYSFKPENGTKVTMAVCSYGSDGSMQFGTFSSKGVSAAEDGTVTLSGITAGKTIVKLENNGNVKYQVLRAKHTDVKVTDGDGKVILDTAGNGEASAVSVAPGDRLTVVYSNLYHPANKLSGIYNMSASINAVDSSAKTYAGTANQYLFASTAAAHTITVNVPSDARDSYSVNGTIKSAGWGSYYGYHRLLKYEEGKTANFTAVQQTGYFGALPEISLEITKSVNVTLSIVDGEQAPVADCNIELSCGGTAVQPSEGAYVCFPGKTYSYAVTAQGYPRKLGSFYIPEDAGSSFPVTITLDNFSAGAWNGSDSTEPAISAGAYQIATGAELAWFASKVNDGTAASANAVLTADIALSNMDWTPIGTSTNKYSGTFDGNGHYITGLYINSTATYQGLFGYVNNGTVKNLAAGGQVKGGNYSAGIVAYLGGKSTVFSCVNHVNVTGGKWSGGVAAFQDAANATIENCYNTGNISGSGQYVGGISGGGSNQVAKSVIKNCYNIGSVFTTGTCAGSLSGAVQTANVSNSYYLDGTWKGTAASNVNKAGTSKSPDELKVLASTLGDGFTDDTTDINGGYPVLVWQNPHIHEDADFNGICDGCKTELGTVKTAAVSYTSQHSGAYLHAPKNSVEISSNLAELYGYQDGISYLESVSVLDILVQAHIDAYGEDYTKQSAAEYLVIGSYGSPDKQFKISSSTAYGGFFLNRCCANDGTESQWGGYNATTVTTQSVKNGDLVEFFFYEDSNYADIYNWFENSDGYSRSFSAETGKPVELTLKGSNAMNAYMFKDESEMLASSGSIKIAEAQIYVIDSSTGAKTEIYGAVTDAEGKVSLTFSEEGTYYIAAYGTKDCANAQIISVTAVAVSKSAVQEYALGDVNGDGNVNSTDAALVYGFHNNKAELSEAQLNRADVNGDAIVNSADAALIYAYHNGKITQFTNGNQK